MNIKNKIYTPSCLADFTFSNVTSQQTISDVVNGKVVFPGFKNAICLWGTFGTGKTTLAKLLPRLLEATANMPPAKYSSHFFESEEYWQFTGCGLRTNSGAFVKELYDRTKTDIYASPKGYFYEILDEADLLGPQAQASLKALISSASDTTIFIMTTNNPQGLDCGIVDRSFMIEMNQPKPADMVPIGRNILHQFGITGSAVTDDALAKFAALSKGSYRDFGAAIEHMASKM